MNTPSREQSPTDSDYLSPRQAVRDLKKYAGDVLSNNEIFRRVGVPQRTGYRILKGPSDESSKPHKKRGRPKKISDEALAEADKLLQSSPNNRNLSWEALGELIGVEASARTIHKALQKKYGYCKRRTCKNRYLTAKPTENRLLYAHGSEDCSCENWNRVLFSDQVYFKLESDKTVTIVRKQEERYCEDCMPESANTHLHAWAAVGWNYKSPLIFYDGRGEGGSLASVNYKTQILQPHIEVHVGQNRYVLLEEEDDNFYENRSIDSPTRAIMDNVWRILEQRLKKHTFSDEEALCRGVLEGWDGIDQGEINKLVQSMKGRVDEAIQHQGKMTQF